MNKTHLSILGIFTASLACMACAQTAIPGEGSGPYPDRTLWPYTIEADPIGEGSGPYPDNIPGDVPENNGPCPYANGAAQIVPASSLSPAGVETFLNAKSSRQFAGNATDVAGAKVTVGKRGRFTASARVGGRRVSFRGNLNGVGAATVTTGKTQLALQLGFSGLNPVLSYGASTRAGAKASGVLHKVTNLKPKK